MDKGLIESSKLCLLYEMPFDPSKLRLLKATTGGLKHSANHVAQPDQVATVRCLTASDAARLPGATMEINGWIGHNAVSHDIYVSLMSKSGWGEDLHQETCLLQCCGSWGSVVLQPVELEGPETLHTNNSHSKTEFREGAEIDKGNQEQRV
jgi:hypothetical protein